MNDELDYLTLVREAKTPDLSPDAPVFRLALLGDFAPQQLAPVLISLFARRGVRLDLYQGEFDTLEQDVLNPSSALYAFKPDAIALLPSSFALHRRLYRAPNRFQVIDQITTHFKEMWAAIARLSQATILQASFVLPPERAFGNFELSTPESLGANVSAINCEILKAAHLANNVLVLDTDFIAAAVGRSAFLDSRLWYLSKSFCALEHMPRLAEAIVQMIRATQGHMVKCVVLDLDNTLWGGTIGEDGLDGLILGGGDEGEAYQDFQSFLLELKRRGVLLAVVSKNDEAMAHQPFREHPGMILREEDIAVFIANWDSKVANIKRVQERLGFDFRALVFIDNDSFERNAVRHCLPDVQVPEMPEDPALFIRTLTERNLFETTAFSETDNARTGLAHIEADRALAKDTYATIDDYLASLDMTVITERFTAAAIPRIAQLIQRSNHFNLTTHRYTPAACEAMRRDPLCLPLALTLNDRFGDYGLIAIVIAGTHGDALRIDSFLLSCRALKRGVEECAMNSLFAYARTKGFDAVEGCYIQSPQNAGVRDFYKDFGFEKIEESDQESLWRLRVADFVPQKTFVRPSSSDAWGTYAG